MASTVAWDVLDEGLGINNLQFLIKKNFSCKFFPIFAHQFQNPGSGSELLLNCWWRHATLLDLFVFIVQYEDMSRRIHCLHCLA
jgi:hypothetical protein